ncbi:hypothetical protein AB0323_16080 [Arthrobacter sp. NPDC080031]|uniref:hypothetical protein n=1 Tax=Arthrobacter sp. NPDC080031 TaxID=3155918 RepID=UPI00344C569C
MLKLRKSMMTLSAPTAQPATLRRLDTSNAATLVHLSASFEDLQTVLRCCERLVSALTPGDDPPDDVLIEAVWTTALLSYGRCFSYGRAGANLTENDLAATNLKGDLPDWHRVLLKLRDHYTSRTTNPRELFSVGLAQDPDGAANGIAITSARQPLVEDLAVRQTGAIALALSDMVDARITALQPKIFAEYKDTPKSELDKLPRFEVSDTP